MGGFKKLDDMFEEIIRSEGGYVDDPKDSGGPTNYGVTWKTWLRHRPLIARTYQEISNKDAASRYVRGEVKKITAQEAKEIFKKDYWERPGFYQLPWYLQPQVVDIAVNAGPGRAGELLQKALVKGGAKIKVDGKAGPKTRAAIGTAFDGDLRKLNNALVDARNDFYRDLVKREPEKAKYLKGWLARSERYRQP